MYPSKQNANATPSKKDSNTSKYTTPYKPLEETGGPFNFQMTNPAVPLLPSNPYNNQAGRDMEPPSYTLAVAQDSNQWTNRFGSFSGPNNQPPWTPGYAPYPTGPVYAPGFAGNVPFAGFGYIPRPGNQAPVDTGKQTGFMAPVTIEPKSVSPGYLPGEFQGKVVMQGTPYSVNGNQQGLIYPTTVGETKMYIQTDKTVPNEYGNKQPNTTHGGHKNGDKDGKSNDDSCCSWIKCCLGFCNCVDGCLTILIAVCGK